LDFLSLDYRDPLYGIILLIVIVVIIKVSDYWARYFKKKDDDRDIKKIIKVFENSSNNDEYKSFILRKDLPLESIVLMAMTYDKTGEFEKSIDIYSTLLLNLKNGKERVNVLTLLGKSYYKAGFLYKSRDTFLTALKIYPKNTEALTYLVSIYESLRNYYDAIEILNILENISGDVSEKKLYFKILAILNNNDYTDQEKLRKVINLGIDKQIVQRKLLEFATLKKLKLSSEILSKFDFENVIDILWDYDGELFSEDFIKQNKLLSAIYTLKGKGEFAQKSDNFELNILLKLRQLKDKSADLSFTYSCKNCKNVFPLYFYRCPVCKNINSAVIDTTLTRREYETGSFV
jgi:lipopolysaccharide biosynthesis regulator YciM